MTFLEEVYKQVEALVLASEKKGAVAERARIVALLREWAESYEVLEASTGARNYREAADRLEEGT